MFVLKPLGKIEGSSGYTKAILFEPTPGESRRVCYVQTWGFDSCAVMNLYSFNGLYGWKDKFNADEFFNFLRTVDDPNWKPREAYFLVSTQQLKDNDTVRKLVAHPKVKAKDKFLNKAHGPNCVTLFRWSDEQDFKRRLRNAN